MSNLPSLQPLADHREALLLAEVAAWLHMLGKLHENFLAGNHSLATQIPQDIPDGLKNLLQDTWISKFWVQLGISEFQSDNLNIASLIASHQTPDARTGGFERLMWDAHGRGSGTEKGVLERFFPGQKEVFLSTAFGYEPAKLIDSQSIQNTRKELYAFLEQNLDFLKAQGEQVDWSAFRQSFISKIEAAFRLSVAETRHPINDVTLFDQTFASVAFFKAALAQNLLMGWKEPNQKEVKNKYHWRILRIGIDGLRFWGNSPKLTDVLGRKTVLEKALDRVQRLLEEEYPLGAEVYRDENGSLFIVPDVPDLLDARLESTTLRDRLQQIAQTELEEEALFTLILSNRTRTMLSFGELVSAELPPPSANPKPIDSIWRSLKEKTDVCTVCNVRPQGYDGPGKPLNRKALDRNVCGICERRRVDRAANWAKDLTTTVWTNEVADENGRLALIVGQFGLERWLSGEMLASIMAFDPSERTLIDKERGDKECQFNYARFLKEIEQALTVSKQPGQETPLLDYLLLKYHRIGNTFAETYDFFVSDTDLHSGQREAWRFALALMRQQPSPARLRRLWETTRGFWQTALDEKDKQGNPVLVPAAKRLEIVPKSRDKLDLGNFHAYELVVNRIRISVVWDSEKQHFVVCENLAYLAKPERLGKPLRDYLQHGSKFVLEEPAGYGAENKQLGEITIEQVNELDDSYLPVIPILAEPRTFMALVPADRALEVLKAIKTKYEREMGKVRNRLPLHLGVVFADRRMPLMAVLDAGRQMLARTTDERPWTVNAKADHDPLPDGKPRCVKLDLARNDQKISLEIPTVMGDGATFDPWYPYWRVEGKPTDRNYWFIGPEGEHWVHVSDLRPDDTVYFDTVYFTPSTFDFEYLDSASRRFAIAYEYEADGRRFGRPTRPFLLEDLERLEKIWEVFSKLSRTQVKQVLQTIETTRERWFGRDEAHKDETFRRFVEDTLANAEWPKEQPWKSKEIASPSETARNDTVQTQLVTAAARGELADLAELHLEILKEK